MLGAPSREKAKYKRWEKKNSFTEKTRLKSTYVCKRQDNVYFSLKAERA